MRESKKKRMQRERAAHARQYRHPAAHVSESSESSNNGFPPCDGSGCDSCDDSCCELSSVNSNSASSSSTVLTVRLNFACPMKDGETDGALEQQMLTVMAFLVEDDDMIIILEQEGASGIVLSDPPCGGTGEARTSRSDSVS